LEALLKSTFMPVKRGTLEQDKKIITSCIDQIARLGGPGSFS
jgi:hypothetical protein